MQPAEPIYEALENFQRRVSWSNQEWMDFLHSWKDRITSEFKLSVPGFALGIKPLRGAYGHYRFAPNEFGFAKEIALDSRHLQVRPLWKTLLTLGHELLHGWQDLNGVFNKRRPNYHNRQFQAKAAEFGIIVSQKGVTSCVEGPFLDLLKRNDIPLTPDAETGAGVRTHRLPAGYQEGDTIVITGSKLKKWTCPCGVNVRVAIADFQALCLKCEGRFVRVS